MDICWNKRSFILSHTTRNAERGCKRRKNAYGDLKNGLPCVCFHLTHFDSILKVKLKFFVCSREVNFPLVCQDFIRSGEPRWWLLQRGGFYSSLSSPLPSCPASPLLSPLGLEPPPSEPPSGVVGVLMSTLDLPALMALMTAACALRLATRLNSASARRFLNSAPGSHRTFTSVIFWAVNLSASSAPLDEKTMEKSPRPLFLPLFWSSLTTGACRLLRPRFVVYEDRHLVQEKLSFDCWCKGTTIWS